MGLRLVGAAPGEVVGYRKADAGLRTQLPFLLSQTQVSDNVVIVPTMGDTLQCLDPTVNFKEINNGGQEEHKSPSQLTL